MTKSYTENGSDDMPPSESEVAIQNRGGAHMSKYKQELEQLKLSEKEKEKLRALYSQRVDQNSENVTIIKKNRKFGKIIKPAIAAAVCLFVIGGGILSNKIPFVNQNHETEQSTIPAKAMPKNTKENKMDFNPRVPCDFYIEKMSGDLEGITSQEEVPEGYVQVYCEFALDFYCRGENIEKITYTAENGYFHISDITTYNETYTEAVDEYSLSYENQNLDNRFVAFRKQGILLTNKEYDAIRVDKISFKGTSESLEMERKTIASIFEDIRINCEVTYSDGSTEKTCVKPVVSIENSVTGHPQEEYYSSEEMQGQLNLAFETVNPY